MLIDTHCHLDFDAYDADRAEVIARTAEHGVNGILIPAIDTDSSESAKLLAAQYPGIWYAVGVHPNSTADFAPEHLQILERQAAQPGVVSIGEIGLDYYWDRSPKAKQHQAFEAQLELASRLQLPVIIHNREASEDVIAILERWVNGLSGTLRERPGVLHSFSAPRPIAEKALSLGFYLGFTGPITFKNAHDLRLIAAATPKDRILVETDGPFLTPHPHRGQRNEPAYVRFVAERLADLHNVSAEEIADQTTQNALRLFNLLSVAR